MPENSETASMLRQAADLAEQGYSILLNGERDLTTIQVAINELERAVKDATVKHLQAMAKVRQSKELASATAAGTSNRAVMGSIAELQRVDDTTADDVRRLNEIKNRVETMRGIAEGVKTNTHDDAMFVVSARDIFRAHAQVY